MQADTPEMPAVDNEKIKEDLTAMLDKMAVAKIYFVDDNINTHNNRDVFIGLLSPLVIQEDKLQELRNIENIGLDFSASSEVLIEQIKAAWDELSESSKLIYFEKIYAISGKPEKKEDLNVSTYLTELLGDKLESLSPEQWRQKIQEIIPTISDSQRIVILFDQELGDTEDGRVDSGDRLILDFKDRLPARENVFTALFTHTITNVADELEARQQIVNNSGGRLAPADFFPLTKLRLSDYAAFADGIKRVLLNYYFESIKEKSLTVIDASHELAKTQVIRWDAYDFDQVVLRTSRDEGIWEPETLFRIANILLNDSRNLKMLEMDYVPQINKYLQRAWDIHDYSFPFPNSRPYLDKYALRHKELYEGDLINKLNKPLENGDIFEIISNGNKEMYVLVGQDCDLMVRKTGMRKTKLGTLLKINTYSHQKLTKKITDFHKGGKRLLENFFDTRYLLYYFSDNSQDYGIVEYTNPVMIDMEVLDLSVFNTSGISNFVLETSSASSDIYSEAWLRRFDLIKSRFELDGTEITKGFAVIDGAQLDPETNNLLKRRLLKNISCPPIGAVNYFSQQEFNFDITRVKRIKKPTSIALLLSYVAYFTRHADEHDFAKGIS